jgi:hypothetical protein
MNRMMGKSGKSIRSRVSLTALAIFALLLGFAGPASAADLDGPTVEDRIGETWAKIMSLDEFFEWSPDGQFISFDLTGSLEAGVDRDFVLDVATGINQGLAFRALSSDIPAMEHSLSGASLAACQGRNGQSGTWPFINYFHNSCKVTTALGVAFLPAWGQRAAAVLNMIVGLGALIITACARSGRGIVIETNPIYGTCRSQ